MFTAHLILLSVVLLATKAPYNICSLSGCTIFKCLAYLFRKYAKLFIDNHGFQSKYIKGERSNRRHLFYFFLQKKKPYSVTRHKTNVSAATTNEGIDNLFCSPKGL